MTNVKLFLWLFPSLLCYDRDFIPGVFFSFYFIFCFKKIFFYCEGNAVDGAVSALPELDEFIDDYFVSRSSNCTPTLGAVRARGQQNFLLLNSFGRENEPAPI